jgi:hypothetical protein
MSEILLCVDFAERSCNRGSSVDELLGEAELLLSMGFARAATVIARSALEQAMKARCHLENCWPNSPKGGRPRRPTAHDVACILLMAGKITRRERKRLSRCLNIASYAAHGGDVTSAQAVAVLDLAKQIRESLVPGRLRRSIVIA